MDVFVAKPEISRKIPETMLVVVPRPVEVLGRIEVIALLDDSPRRAFRRVFTILLIEIVSFFIKLSLHAKGIHTASTSRQLKAICFLRLNVFSGKKENKEILHKVRKQVTWNGGLGRVADLAGFDSFCQGFIRL